MNRVLRGGTQSILHTWHASSHASTLAAAEGGSRIDITARNPSCMREISQVPNWQVRSRQREPAGLRWRIPIRHRTPRRNRQMSRQTSARAAPLGRCASSALAGAGARTALSCFGEAIPTQCSQACATFVCRSRVRVAFTSVCASATARSRRV